MSGALLDSSNINHSRSDLSNEGATSMEKVFRLRYKVALIVSIVMTISLVLTIILFLAVKMQLFSCKDGLTAG